MIENIICEKCGSEMKSIEDSFSRGMICPECGWGWVSTYNEPIIEDYTIYHLSILSANSSMSDIKLISKIANCNYLEAKKIIENTPIEIFCGQAVEIRSIKEQLENANIQLKIEPKFPY